MGRSLNTPKAQISDLGNFLPLGPLARWHFGWAWWYLVFFKCAWVYLIFFIDGGKKRCFRLLFSMLHYSISQSNNSIFVHRRILSCLIVCDSLRTPPPPYLQEFHFPLASASRFSMCRNHGDGSLLDNLCSGLEVKEPIRTLSSQKCKRMKNGRPL